MSIIYQEPTPENVTVRDILIQRMGDATRYLNIVDKTDYSIIAKSQDQNFECLCPFKHFNESIIVKEDNSILAGQKADESLLKEVVAWAGINQLIKRAYREREALYPDLKSTSTATFK